MAPRTGQSQYGQPASLPIDTCGGIGDGQGKGCLSEYHTASMPEAVQGCSTPQSSDLSLLLHERNVPGSSLAPNTLIFFQDFAQHL